jgi:lysozyme family protein
MDDLVALKSQAFSIWWAFVQLPSNDGKANDSAVDNTGHPDGAGWTRYGFTLPTWRAAQVRMGKTDLTLAAFAEETPKTLAPLAKIIAWDALKCAQMPFGIDCMVADWSFTSGGAIHALQAGLGCVPDGIIGPVTLAALHRLTPQAMIPRVASLRTRYYDQCGFRMRWPGLYNRVSGCQNLAFRVALMEPSPPPAASLSALS